MTVSSISPACINEVMNTCADETPKLVMPATMFVGSDRYAMIVLEVKSPKRIIVAHMHNTDYAEYEKNPEAFNGEEAIKKYHLFTSYYEGKEYTLRKNGRWLPKGFGLHDTCGIILGTAENYRDPCF